MFANLDENSGLDTLTFIEEYLDSKLTTRAVLITAPWGSGKTHFFKNSIVPLIVGKGLKSVYVSLNGISTIEEIETQILLQILPKNMRTKFVTNAINIFSRRVLKAELNEIAGGLRLKSIKSSVICYDDLERCELKPSKLWGFINYDIEHSATKTIIMSNDDKVTKELFPIREKNVSRVMIPQ